MEWGKTSGYSSEECLGKQLGCKKEKVETDRKVIQTAKNRRKKGNWSWSGKETKKKMARRQKE